MYNQPGILADSEIIKLCQGNTPMISPFLDHLVREEEYLDTNACEQIRKVISYGCSSGGYDIRLAREDLKVFTNLNSRIIDPRRIDSAVYTMPIIHLDEDGAEYVLLPPNTGMLGHTVEWFNMPRDVLGVCWGKSTYARCFISIIVTPLEPGWEGKLVVEIVNHTNSPAKIYLNQGIGQIVFNRLVGEVSTSYADRGGKYMGQRSTVDALV